jgi:hypothetical protein
MRRQRGVSALDVLGIRRIVRGRRKFAVIVSVRARVDKGLATALVAANTASVSIPSEVGVQYRDLRERTAGPSQ